MKLLVLIIAVLLTVSYAIDVKKYGCMNDCKTKYDAMPKKYAEKLLYGGEFVNLSTALMMGTCEYPYNMLLDESNYCRYLTCVKNKVGLRSKNGKARL